MGGGTKNKNQASTKRREYTEELAEENQRLIQKVNLLRQELAQYAHQPEGGNPQIVAELEALRRQHHHQQVELDDLKTKIEKVEMENRDLMNKYREVDQRNSNLACLYVTSFQLHSTFDHDQVMQSIREVVINLIGTECFGVYLYDPQSMTFVLAGGKGLEDRPGIHKIASNDSLISHAECSGELCVDADAPNGSFDHPVAVLPLLALDELVGILIIYKLLVQKEGLELIDIELLNLLRSQAGIAIKTTQIHSLNERRKMDDY